MLYAASAYGRRFLSGTYWKNFGVGIRARIRSSSSTVTRSRPLLRQDSSTALTTIPRTKAGSSAYARRSHALVLLQKPEFVDVLVDQEFRVPDILDPHPGHHPPGDDRDEISCHSAPCRDERTIARVSAQRVPHGMEFEHLDGEGKAR